MKMLIQCLTRATTNRACKKFIHFGQLIVKWYSSRSNVLNSFRLFVHIIVLYLSIFFNVWEKMDQLTPYFNSERRFCLVKNSLTLVSWDVMRLIKIVVQVRWNDSSREKAYIFLK